MSDFYPEIETSKFDRFFYPDCSNVKSMMLLDDITTLMLTMFPMPPSLRNLLHFNNLSIFKLSLQFFVRNMTPCRIRTLPLLLLTLPVELQKLNLHARATHKLHGQHH